MVRCEKAGKRARKKRDLKHEREVSALRKRYGPGNEGRRDCERDRKSQDIADRIRAACFQVLRLTLDDADMGIARLHEQLRKERLGAAGTVRPRYLEPPDRPCKLWCEEPAGDGWADD